MKLIREIIVLLLTFGFVIVWQQTILSQYIVQILGALIFLYIIIALKKKFTTSKIVFGGYSDIFILVSIVLLLVIATNGLSGGMFFLLYLLLFGISFVLNPFCIFVFLGGIVIVFLPQALNSGDVFSNFIKLGTLFLISPFAFILSRQQDDKHHS